MDAIQTFLQSLLSFFVALITLIINFFVSMLNLLLQFVQNIAANVS